MESRDETPTTAVTPGDADFHMGLFRWFERKLFTGDVLHDYGDIQDDRKGIARIRTRVLLCRRNGRLKLVFRQAGTSPFGASVYYSIVEVTPASLDRLQEIVSDAKRELHQNTPPLLGI